MTSHLSRDDECLIHTVLADNTLFCAMQNETREMLFQGMTVKRYKAGEWVHSRSEPVAVLMIMLSGSLELGVLSTKGKQFVRWYLEPGQIYSLVPAIDGKNALYDARAFRDSAILLIPRTAFLQALENDSGFNKAVVGILCDRSRNAERLAALDALSSLRGRAARMLLLLADTYGQKRDDGIVINLKLSQEVLSNLLSVSRQNLNSVLAGLKTEGIIGTAYSQITILDAERLKVAASSSFDEPQD